MGQEIQFGVQGTTQPLYQHHSHHYCSETRIYTNLKKNVIAIISVVKQGSKSITVKLVQVKL